MDRDEYQPSPIANVAVEEEGDGATLVFVRELRHAPERVWRVLTDPAELREWAPFDADRDLGTPGETTLRMAGGEGGEGEVMTSSIRRAEPPRLLEYTWGASVLRWQLEPTDSGSRLTLRQSLDDRSWLPKVAAGWHICLDVADQYLSGHPIGRIVGNEARHFGWEALNEEYASRLRIEDTGWPLGGDSGTA